MLPLMNSFTSASSGPHGSFSNATADMIWPGCAVAALIGIMGKECRLHRMQIFRLTNPFDRRDLVAFMHDREAETRIHPPAIDVHRAGTALSVVAAFFRSGQMQMFAQAVE